MKKLLLVLGIALFLTGCIGEDYVVVKKRIKQYEVVGIDPPKRFFVDLRDIETGHVYKHERVSKRCSNWRKLRLGSTWTFTERTHKNGMVSLGDVHTLCDRLG